MAQVIVFANHKGGCSKTTSVANVGAALAQLGRSVVMIDADPQANLSEAFGVEADHPGLRLEDLLDDSLVAARPWQAEELPGGRTGGLPGGLALVPCSERLEEVVSARRDAAGALGLREVVEAMAPDFDFVLMDTPPGLGPLSSMAMLAAGWVIVPARPADFDVGGAVKVADLVEGQLRELHPELRVLGVLVCQVDRRWALRFETRAALKEAGVARLRAEVPFMVRVGAAPRSGVPTVVSEPRSPVSLAYRQVARDLIGGLERGQG